MDAVIWEHDAGEGPYRLAPALERSGFSLRSRLCAPVASDADAPLLVVMGGPMGVYEADAHPYLKVELELLRRRLARGLPTLGICLGAQLLARAAGAEVSPGEQGFEYGVRPILLTHHARADDVFAKLPAMFDVAHWHGDTFSEVPGGTLLASSDAYRQQAFRVGVSYGLQFHPELDPEILADWGRAMARPVPPEHLARLSAGLPVLDELMEQLAGFFAAAVRQSSDNERPITSR